MSAITVDTLESPKDEFVHGREKLELPNGANGILPTATKDAFKEAMMHIAQKLGNLKVPCERQLCSYRPRLLLEDSYAQTWKRYKLAAGRENEAQVKQELRAEGADNFFKAVVDKLLHSQMPTKERERSDRKLRFSVAIRLANHLSPDGGEELHSYLNRVTDSRVTDCPLYLAHAYQALLVPKEDRSR